MNRRHKQIIEIGLSTVLTVPPGCTWTDMHVLGRSSTTSNAFETHSLVITIEDERGNSVWLYHSGTWQRGEEAVINLSRFNESFVGKPIWNNVIPMFGPFIDPIYEKWTIEFALLRASAGDEIFLDLNWLESF